MPKGAHGSSHATKPEKKIGPFLGGIGAAIWLNTIETENGPRQVRSISLSPRRYRDSQTGEWKDAGSYRPGDLPGLIYCLQKAQEYCFTEPLPGEEDEHGS